MTICLRRALVLSLIGCQVARLAGEDGSTQYVGLRKAPCPHRTKNPLLDDSATIFSNSGGSCGRGGRPGQASVDWDGGLPRLPHVLGEPSLHISNQEASRDQEPLLSISNVAHPDLVHRLGPEECRMHAAGLHSLSDNQSAAENSLGMTITWKLSCTSILNA